MNRYNVEIGGFIMVPDRLITELGFLSAGLYGRIWRYEQGSSGVCKASLDTLAENLGIGRDTVAIHIQKLIDAQYIIDDTPDLRNHPHTLRTTKKLKLTLELVPDFPVPENPTVLSENPTVLSENPTVGCRIFRHEETQTNKETRRERGPLKNIDLVDGFLAYNKMGLEHQIDLIEDTLCQLEKGLRRSIQRSGLWQDLAKYIIKREKAGESLEAWIIWYMSEPFNAKTSWRIRPQQIRESWPQAFINQTMPTPAGDGSFYG